MDHPTTDDLCAVVIDPQGDFPHLSEHLESCAQCQQQVAGLQRTLGLLHTTNELELVDPPAELWAGIATATAAPGNHTSWALRASRTIQLVAASVLIGLFGGWLVWGQQPTKEPEPPAQTVLAATTLQDQTTKQERGQAQLLGNEDQVTLRVRLNGSRPEQVLTVWMTNPDTGELVSVGLLDPESSTGSFPIPGSLYRSGFREVTLSRGAKQVTAPRAGDKLFSGRLKQDHKHRPRPSPKATTSPRPTRKPSPTVHPRPSETAEPTSKAAPSQSPSASPTATHTTRPRRTPSAKPRLDPAVKLLRRQAKACRALLATQSTGESSDRIQRRACREVLRQWRAKRSATPLPQPRTVQEGQLQPEVLPQPSQT
ncbi:MAG TPA: hypothetical protein PKM12_04575 [Marmoricola sp.]|nr:hypothetical protein [Marmoricola sp.]HNI69676.1 hypothetical protein [Marmoricola sp.]HNN48220.1 hypothetical protein [Marmoricola sp.]HNO40260.1 hypothetical protein [Marmoricola sp.]